MELVSMIYASQFTVTEWLTHLAATLKVMGSRPSLGDIYENYFLKSIQYMAQRDFMVCVTLQNLLWPAMYAVLTGKQLPC